MAYSDDAEVGLIQQAARGDASAFAALFNQYFQPIYNYALWLCADSDVAEDLTQEVFIRAHNNLHRLGPPWKLRAWLYRLLKNMFIDHSRREREVESLDPEETLVAPGTDPERTLISGEMKVRIRRVLQRLPSRYREALVLRELDGFSYADIASIMDISDDYVGPLLHRARAQFKAAYGLQVLAEDPLPACTVLNELLDGRHDGQPLADQKRLVQEHLNGCRTCQQRQRELVAFSALFGTLAPIVPPADLAPRILEQTVKKPHKPKAKRRRSSRPSYAIAALVVVAGLLALAAVLSGWSLGDLAVSVPAFGIATPTVEALPEMALRSGNAEWSNDTDGCATELPSLLITVCVEKQGDGAITQDSAIVYHNGTNWELVAQLDASLLNKLTPGSERCIKIATAALYSPDSEDTGFEFALVSSLELDGDGRAELNSLDGLEEPPNSLAVPIPSPPPICTPTATLLQEEEAEPPTTTPLPVLIEPTSEELPGADGSLCGDGICQAGESPNWCGDCSPTSGAVCGNGVIESGEQCDGSGCSLPSVCNSSCSCEFFIAPTLPPPPP